MYVLGFEPIIGPFLLGVVYLALSQMDEEGVRIPVIACLHTDVS